MENLDLNRYAWYAVGAMLVIYLILVLEDLVEAMGKRDVLILRVYGEGEGEPLKTIENASPPSHISASTGDAASDPVPNDKI